MKDRSNSILKKLGDLLEAPWIWLDRFIMWLPLSYSTKTLIVKKKYGFIGTISFHLLVVVLFLVFKVSNSQPNEDSWIYFDLKTLEELAELALQEDIENQELASAQARNIAVNRSEDRVINYDDYDNYRLSRSAVDQVVQSRINQDIKEIIEENDLNPDDEEVPDIQTQQLDFYKAQEVEEDQVYEGPTNIYYKLDNRDVSYLHIPVYKCEGSATVRIDIRVGQRGKVELTSVNGAESDTRDPCFINAAKEAAKRTRFSFSTTAPRLQNGYIIYHFIAQ